MLLAAYQPIGLSSASINFFKAYIRPQCRENKLFITETSKQSFMVNRYR
jgi:hypothetical protein